MRLPPLVLTLAMVLAGPGRGDEVRSLGGHGGPIMDLAVSEDGRSVLSASFDYSVGLRALDDGAPRWLEGHAAAVNAVAFLPGGRAVSAGDDRALILWDLRSRRQIRRMTGHTGKVLEVGVSPDGALIASAGWDRRAGLWDAASGRLVRWIEGHDGGVNDVAFSPDAATLYTASQDGTVRSWEVATGAMWRIEADQGFGVNCLLVDPAGAWLAYGAVDGTTRVIELATGATVAEFMLEERPALALALSRDGARLAVGYSQGSVMLIDTRDWTALDAFRAALSGPLWALAFAEGGALLTGGLDPAIAVWPPGAGGAPHGSLPAFQRTPAEMSNGERQFVRKCSVCHSLGRRADRKAGPPLGGLFGRPAGSFPGYGYSDALAGSGLVWTEATVDRLFRRGPELVVPGSKMPMQRIAGAGDRADLIDFLRRETRPGATD